MDVRKALGLDKRSLPSLVAVLCSFLIVFGMTYVANSATPTTTIGQNISTNNITAAGTLEVTENATITGNQAISGTLDVFGASTLATTSLSGTLTLSGIANLLSNLTVSGDATTTGNQVVSKNFDVFGTSTLATTTISKLTVTGDVEVDKSIFYDDFERANQTGLGTSPTGQEWILTGPGYLTARIENGGYVTDSNTYAGILINSSPIRIGGQFSFNGGSGVLALHSSSDSSLSLGHMIHLIFDDDSARVTWWDGASQNNDLESCSASGAFTPLATDGTIYEIWMTINGDNVHIELPDGNVLDCYDPHVSDVSGRLAVWQITTTAAPYARWESVGSFHETITNLYGTLTVPGGIQGTPIGSVSPSVVYANRIGIGTTSPSEALEVYGNIKITSATAPQLFLTAPNNYGAYINFFTGGISSIYSYGNARDLRFQTGSVDRIVIPAGGNIGIGDSTPDAHLEVSANGGSGGNIFLLSSDDGNDGDLLTVAESGRVGIGTSTPSELFHLYDSTATSTMYINSGGAGLGGRIILEDSDGSGCTEIICNDGNYTFSTVTCP